MKKSNLLFKGKVERYPLRDEDKLIKVGRLVSEVRIGKAKTIKPTGSGFFFRAVPEINAAVILTCAHNILAHSFVDG